MTKGSADRWNHRAMTISNHNMAVLAASGTERMSRGLYRVDAGNLYAEIMPLDGDWGRIQCPTQLHRKGAREGPT